MSYKKFLVAKENPKFIKDLSSRERLGFKFFERPVLTVAQELLGCILVRKLGDGYVYLKIVETEAYHEKGDPSCHAHKGKTKRNEVMFGPPGRLYVYFTYGMHYCMNIVAEKEGVAAAVLIRALEPIMNLELIQRIHPNQNILGLFNGPAKLCKSLQITKKENGLDLTKSDSIYCIPGEKIPRSKILSTPRIGISQAKDLPWRFLFKDSPFLSRRIHPNSRKKMDYSRNPNN